VSLYKIWDANKRHPAWPEFKAFRDWTLQEGWLEEHGFEGEFSPDNLKAAVPEKEIDVASILTPGITAEQLVKKLNAEKLKQLAEELKVEIPEEADTKKKIAELILEAEVMKQHG
jgi:hypothetical protein